jgi:hypothetical protein
MYIVTALIEFVCQSIGFLTGEFGIIYEECLTRRYIESLILQRNSVYDVAYLLTH